MGVQEPHRADIGELRKGPRAALDVELVDRDGNPIAGTLSIRDRMYESWAVVVERGSTLYFADDPIPKPPLASLIDGRCQLARVRAGRVEFVLTLIDGRRVFFVRDVVPAEPSRIRLHIPSF